MTRTADITKPVENDRHTTTSERPSGQSAPSTDRKLDGFLAELRRMTPEERIRASRYSMNRREYWIYAARFPDEVPTINGELELIAATLE
jgi:hypothetical protein